MRHRKANVKLGRTASHRDAMLRNMVTSLFEYEKITTTLHKAKALRPLADKLVGLAKRGKSDLHALRQAAVFITKRPILNKIFDDAALRFSDRPSGYTTMVKVAPRKGDAAPMVVLELMKQGEAKAAFGSGVAKKTGDRSKRVAKSKATALENTAAPEAPAETPAA